MERKFEFSVIPGSGIRTLVVENYENLPESAKEVVKESDFEYRWKKKEGTRAVPVKSAVKVLEDGSIGIYILAGNAETYDQIHKWYM